MVRRTNPEDRYYLMNLRQHGNVIQVTIPTAIARSLKMFKRQHVLVSMEEGRVIVEPLDMSSVLDRRKTLGATPAPTYGWLKRDPGKG